MTNFWPEDIAKTSHIITPATILRSAAADLTQKTNQLLRCAVSTTSTGEQIQHNLEIIAPAVNNYRYHVLTAYHNITLYPASLLPSGENAIKAISCPDPETFSNALREILARPQIRKVIAALLIQST